jgi:hypothetical protein
MTTALFAPPDSLAPGLAGALGVLGQSVDELPWGGDLRSGVALAGHDVLVTVAPRPRLGPLAAIEHAAWTEAIRDIAERPAAAARGLLRAGGKRWIAVIPTSARCRAPAPDRTGRAGSCCRRCCACP